MTISKRPPLVPKNILNVNNSNEDIYLPDFGNIPPIQQSLFDYCDDPLQNIINCKNNYLDIDFYNLSPINDNSIENSNEKAELRKKFNVNNLPIIPTLAELKASKLNKNKENNKLNLAQIPSFNEIKERNQLKIFKDNNIINNTNNQDENLSIEEMFNLFEPRRN